MGLISTLFSVAQHCSEPIFDLMLRRTRDWISGRILETKVAGKSAAGICRCLCKVRPEKGLKAFLVPAMDAVERLLDETVDVTKEETVDEELKFNLQVIADVS